MKIKLGKGLDVPAHELATSVWAALGIRGSGKSNLAAVAAEGILDAGIPVVVIDSVGPWFSLRLGPDGKTASRFKIPVLGGVHGDIALPPGAGRQVAEALAASASSAVLDVSMMGKGERVRFAADFAEAFFEAKKRNPGPVSVIVEESQRMIPQVMRFADPALSRCLGAFEEMAEIGRNFGIGIGLLSLRPQKINKDVLNLAETVFAFRTLGVLERKAIAEWVQEKGAEGRNEVSGELPSLAKGTAIVWSPSLFDVYGQFKLALKSTYDASATPDKARAAVTMKPLDLAQLQSRMEDFVREAKANDPKILKARIAELERAIAKGSPVAPVAKASPEVRIEYRCPKEIRRLIQVDMVKVAAAFADLRAKALGVVDTFPEIGVALGVRDSSPIAVTRAPQSVAPSVTLVGDRNVTDASGGQGRMLRALAATLKDGLSRRELGALSGVKSSGGTFGTYLSRLRQAGHVEDGGAGIRITAAGRAIAGVVPQLTGQELLDFWLPQLGEKPANMLRVLFGAAEPVSRDAMAEAVSLAGNAGTFGTYLSRLTSRGLVEKVGRNQYRCAEVFRQ